MLLCILFIGSGCSKETNESIINDLKSNYKNIKSYKINGTMEISNDEESFNYSLEVSHLKDNYYKVILVNQTNNHEQIILRNNGDVYVITPLLNKSFKFQSNWPNNSSQAYLPEIIIDDIEKDKKSEINKNDDKYIIKTVVNYPNNGNLKYQKIYLNNNKELEKVEVYDENDLVKIKVMFNKISINVSLKEEDFNLDNFIKDIEDKNNEVKSKCENGEPCEEKTTEEKETSSIENVIYPLYIPQNTYLTNSEKIDTIDGNRVILTFGGDKNFVLIEEAMKQNSSMEIIPVYGEPFMLTESIGALSANSLNWYQDNISYYLASTELTVDDMQLIANSLGNSTLVANTK